MELHNDVQHCCASTAFASRPFSLAPCPLHVSFCEQRERSGKIQLMDLTQHFHLPINDAAKALGICPTVLKKICRRHGMRRWPHRKVLCGPLTAPGSSLLPNTCCPVRAQCGLPGHLVPQLRTGDHALHPLLSFVLQEGVGSEGHMIGGERSCYVPWGSSLQIRSLDRIIATLEETVAAGGGTPAATESLVNEIKALKREKELLCAGNLGSL